MVAVLFWSSAFFVKLLCRSPWPPLLLLLLLSRSCLLLVMRAPAHGAFKNVLIRSHRLLISPRPCLRVVCRSLCSSASVKGVFLQRSLAVSRGLPRLLRSIKGSQPVGVVDLFSGSKLCSASTAFYVTSPIVQGTRAYAASDPRTPTTTAAHTYKRVNDQNVNSSNTIIARLQVRKSALGRLLKPLFNLDNIEFPTDNLLTPIKEGSTEVRQLNNPFEPRDLLG